MFVKGHPGPHNAETVVSFNYHLITSIYLISWINVILCVAIADEVSIFCPELWIGKQSFSHYMILVRRMGNLTDPGFHLRWYNTRANLVLELLTNFQLIHSTAGERSRNIEPFDCWIHWRRSPAKGHEHQPGPRIRPPMILVTGAYLRYCTVQYREWDSQSESNRVTYGWRLAPTSSSSLVTTSCKVSE